jgi:hypothetical protein
MTTLKTITDSLPLLGSKPDKGVLGCPKKPKVQEKADKPRKPIRKVSLKRAKEKRTDSEMAVFDHIWETRKHVSEFSGKPLPYKKGHSRWHWQFCHVISKGISKKLRTDPENIMLGLEEEHARQNTFPAFIKKLEQLTRKHYSIKVKK